MYYLIYFSKATKQMSDNELTLLVQQAKRYNHLHDLTGLLVYLEGISDSGIETLFMQMIEGSKEEVEKVFEKIKHDGRHSNVVLHKDGFSESRSFNDWSMKIERIRLSENLELSSMFELKEHVLQSNPFRESDAMLDFLMAF
jgi:hypothetical protein